MKFTEVQSILADIQNRAGSEPDGLLDQADAQVRHLVGLGVARAGAGDFKLAVRTQATGAEVDQFVLRISQEARGEVDVRHLGVVLAESRQRPLRVGSSIGPPTTATGTLGAFVKDRGDGALMVLTCRHVVAPSARSALGQAVIQPSTLDGGHAERDLVATVTRHGTMSGANPWDAAVATVQGGVECSLERVSGVIEPGEVLLGASVWKVGRTTGRTRGTVTAVGIELSVAYGGALVRFRNLIEVSPVDAPAFSRAGDSGALVLAEGDQAVGLHTAGSGTASFCQPIGQLLDLLGVDLPS